MSNEIKAAQFLVPAELHQRFKVQAAKDGRTMTDIVTDAIRAYLDEHEPMPPSVRGTRARRT